MANKIQKCISWDNHLLIICPCAGGNIVLESVTSPRQDLSRSLISTFLGLVFTGNLQTTAATTVLKLLLKTWLSLGFLSRTNSALNPNHHTDTPLTVRTAAFLSHCWLRLPPFPWHTPPFPAIQHSHGAEGRQQPETSFGIVFFPSPIPLKSRHAILVTLTHHRHQCVI